MKIQDIPHESPVIHEITPLSNNDCFYLADRHKSTFDFPIHSHPEYELNYIGNGAGIQRTVGDHSETVGNDDLVLIASPNLEHAWEQGVTVTTQTSGKSLSSLHPICCRKVC